MFESEFLTGTAASQALYRELMARVMDVLCSSLPNRPYNGKSPAALSGIIDAQFLPDAGAETEAVFGKLRGIVSNSLLVSHPNSVAHLHCAPLLTALAAEAATSALNQSMDSFDLGPAATILEQKFVHWLTGEAGLPATAGGTLTSGGTQSNYMGLLLARDAYLKSRFQWATQKRGLPPEAARMRVLCSEVAHFTVEKSAMQLGLGTDAVVRVAVDDQFRMRPESLRVALADMRSQNQLPFAIVATAGTTDFGSVDPLPEIGALARTAGAWLHVDAAYGGVLLFSQLYRDKLEGIEAADSLGIDFHKLFWQPVPASAFLLRDAGHFKLIELHADYLNPRRMRSREFLTWSRTRCSPPGASMFLSCGFHFSSWAGKKLATMIDRTIQLAACATDAVRRTPALQLIHGAALSTVVFRYVASRPGLDEDGLNAALRQRLFNQGVAVIGHTRVSGRQCLKFSCMNPAVTDAQMEELVRIVVECGRELEQERAVT